MKYCLEYKCRFKKYELEFLYYFLKCNEVEFERHPRNGSYTKSRLAYKVVTRFSDTKHEGRFFNYNKVITQHYTQHYVRYFNYDGIKQHMVDEFDKILYSIPLLPLFNSIPLLPLFKKVLKIPLDIANDIRNLSRRQQNESVIRRLFPEDNVRDILNVPQTLVQNTIPSHQQVPQTLVQNTRPSHQQVPQTLVQNTRPSQPIPNALGSMIMLPVLDNMLPDTPKECCICLEEIEKDKMCYLNCSHFFHLDCVVGMCASKTNCSQKCPMCRVPVTNTNVSQQAFLHYFTSNNKAIHVKV
jgi:hypothetical protein